MLSTRARHFTVRDNIKRRVIAAKVARSVGRSAEHSIVFFLPGNLVGISLLHI